MSLVFLINSEFFLHFCPHGYLGFVKLLKKKEKKKKKTCREAIYRSGFKCQRCSKSYSSKDVFLDLTVTAGFRDYTEVNPARTELFRYSLILTFSICSACPLHEASSPHWYLGFEISYLKVKCIILYKHVVRVE